MRARTPASSSRARAMGLSGMCGSRSTSSMRSTPPAKTGPRSHSSHRVSPIRIEVGRITALEHRGAASRMLGEYGEGTSVVLEVVDDDSIVWNEPLCARGEVGQKVLRVEFLLQRSSECRHAGEKIPEG